MKIAVRKISAIVSCLVISAFAAVASAQASVPPGTSQLLCDDQCRIEAGFSANYAVVAPVGKQTVPMIKQAPRLDTLDGKTIAVVGGSFMAYVTHPEIKRLILKHYPKAKVILLNEIGSAGVFPQPQ